MAWVELTRRSVNGADFSIEFHPDVLSEVIPMIEQGEIARVVRGKMSEWYYAKVDSWNDLLRNKKSLQITHFHTGDRGCANFET